MLLGRPKKLAVTLICYISIALTLTSVSEAKDYADLQRRDHEALNRLVKKRSPQLDTTTSAASSAASSLPLSSSSRSAPAVSSAASSIAAVSTTSSRSSSSATSSSSRSLSSLSTPRPTLTNAATISQLTGGPRTIVTSTTVSAADPTSTDAEPSSTSHTGRTVITILIAIAASVGGIVIVWTIIRKWKLSKSDSFEDRMQPIDWQPTTGAGGLPVHRRASAASSFHSGAGHDPNIAAYGVGDGYGSADHNHGAAGLGPLPDHDFTAGTANQHFAPVGGYADLARGTGPEPQMQEAYGHGPAAYGGYATHDAYDYPGGAGARY